MQDWSPKDLNVVTCGQTKSDNELAPKHNEIMTLFFLKKTEATQRLLYGKQFD